MEPLPQQQTKLHHETIPAAWNLVRAERKSAEIGERKAMPRVKLWRSQTVKLSGGQLVKEWSKLVKEKDLKCNY